HERIACALLHSPPGAENWIAVPMAPSGEDSWQARFVPAQLGRHRYTVAAWLDAFATWRHKFARRTEPDDVDLALREGAALVRAAGARARGPERGALLAYAASLESDAPLEERRQSALTEALRELMAASPDRSLETVYDPPLEVVVERPLARCAAWYEFFPRSTAAPAAHHGTLATAARHLEYVAAMGFDVVYLPPIHPIGAGHRKGRNNSLRAAPGDPGSPWAIGADDGGHKSVHAELGTLEDFASFRREAERLRLEVALDVAFQCSPEHPYVREHPLWFARRPDGTVQFAENPPKKYEDIYPIDFGTAEWRALWRELRDVVLFWIDQGVKIFRVDNPHTKPFDFWRWLIADVRERHPDTIFLAEAFSRPRVMFRLAKLGFSQSYTYFTWRNSKHELIDYFTELEEARDWFRPNLWPNTPDILHEYLQTGGRPAFMARAALAATLGASYGVYGPAFELLEHEPRDAGSEEYLHSEKYEIKRWDLEREDSLKDYLSRLNAIRRENPALQHDDTLTFRRIDNEQLICYSKTGQDGDNIVLVVVNLDPRHAQSGFIDVPLDEWRLSAHDAYHAHELLSGERYEWQGDRVFVTLSPAECPACIFRIEARHAASERDFDYFI
ncbi:MAG TPA: alpha-1,4-glucan--maltose-1-phosphate maltosyltransferase, partial [Gammaproteobacteria bacterium]